MELVHVAHILVRHQYEAEDIQKRLREGEDFEKLARVFSICSSAKQGGDLGLVPLARLDEDFAEALRGLKKDELSGPVRTRFGYHLIQRKN